MANIERRGEVQVPLDFPTSALNEMDIPGEWSRGISSRKDKFVYEHAPNKILELPRLPQAGNLEIKDTIVFKQIVHLTKERSDLPNAHMFRHLEAGNLVVLPSRDIPIIHAENLALLLRHAGVAKPFVAPSRLVLTERDTCHFCTVINASENGKRTPSTANILE